MERGEGLKEVEAALSVIATDEQIRVSGSNAVPAKCAAQANFLFVMNGAPEEIRTPDP